MSFTLIGWAGRETLGPFLRPGGKFQVRAYSKPLRVGRLHVDTLFMLRRVAVGTREARSKN